MLIIKQQRNSGMEHTMTIQILNNEQNNDYKFFLLASGKKSASFVVFKNRISICCNNASHSAWRGAGRVFANFNDAKLAYKSSAMQAMIAHVQNLIQ